MNNLARKIRRGRTLLLLGVLCSASGCSAQNQTVAQSTPAPGNGFKLQDTLGRNWRNEIVTFTPSPDDLKNAQAKRTLVAPDGKAVAYQIVKNGNAEKIAFAADLDAFETRTYRFTMATAQPASELKIEENADGIRVSNGKTGVLVRSKLGERQGAIAGVLLPSGQWTGDTQLSENTPAFTEYSAAVTARGPVFAEVLCRAQTAEKQVWETKFRLPVNAPAVLVEEYSTLPGDASYALDLSGQFAQGNVLHRMGRSSANGRVGVLKSWKIAADAEPAFVLEPWLRWWMRDRQGNWFGLYNDNGNDLLGFAAFGADTWIEENAKVRPPLEMRLEKNGDALSFKVPLAAGKRKWMIGVSDKSESVKLLEEKDLQVAPVPQQQLIRYGDFPLERVKDEMNFAQSTQAAEHPRLYITKAQAAEHSKKFKPDEKLLAQYLKTPLNVTTIEGPIAYFLGTGDEELGKLLAEAAIVQTQSAVDMFTQQNSLVSLGFAPHHQTQILVAMNMLDAVMDTPHITPEMRARLHGQIAFLGHTVNRGDYWSPERGFAANPNMTSTVAAYQTVLGAMLPHHPKSKQWMTRGLDELYTNQLLTWSDENGGWLEAPAYALASYDYLIGAFLLAKNAGMPQYLFDPRMKKVAEWLGLISTPPDAGVLGYRHLPPIGNSYFNQITGEFGLMAGLWKEHDPQFASEMQWMYKQHGSDPIIAVGGRHATMAGYRKMLIDSTIVEKAPSYGSALFPQTGAVLRNHYGTERENFLHIIAGNNHAHYDKDSGSIVLWGKGRRIADDFGYQGYMPGDDHNMVVSPVAHDDQIFHVQEYSPAKEMDYIRGQKQGWTRQIVFVKSDDPMGANYFVMSDKIAVPAPATWRLWLASNDVQVKPQGALAVGEHDVDTDIFFARPSSPSLKTEKKTRDSYGIKSDGKYDKMSWTQTGLISEADGKSGAPAYTTVLFPRLKTEKPPTFTSLADGKVVKVQSGDTTDYVFLSDTPFDFKAEGIEFQGTSGLARIRGGKATVSLGAAGSISALGQSLKKAADKNAAASTGKINLVNNGDFETGENTLFNPPPAGGTLEVSVHEGNPVAGSYHKGRYVLKLEKMADGNGSYSMKQPPYLDRTKKYRVSVKVYTPDAIHAMLTGYGSDGKKWNLNRDDGVVWGYSADVKGPTQAWHTMETSIGPAGSGAKYIFPSDLLQISMTLRFPGTAGVLYVDDISVEEITQ